MPQLLNISEDLQIDLKKVIGRCISILGIRGSGKTNTSAVVLEEMLKYKYPMTIVDIDGEYWGLKEKYEILVVGNTTNADIQVNVEHARQIAMMSISKNIPVILDMSGFLYEETYEFLLNYMEEIWDLSAKYRKPYEIILEESHEFIPQGTKNDLKEILIRIALRGRKRGLGIIILSQRSAKVEKDVLTQAEILFMHKVVHPTDMKVYKEILPLPSKEVAKSVSELQVGQCILFFENNIKKIQIREQMTFHAGFTPSLKSERSPRLKEISTEILKSVKTLTQSKRKEKSKIERLESKVHRLEAELVEKDNYIQKVERDIETISRIKIEVKQPKIAHTILPIEDVHALYEKMFPGKILNGELTPEQLSNIGQEDNKIYGELPKNVKDHVDKILKRIKNARKSDRAILNFLINRYPISYTYSEMSEWINYSESTLQHQPPTTLLNLGILARTQKMDGFHYSSNLDNFVKEEFQVYFEDEDSPELELILQHIKESVEENNV